MRHSLLGKVNLSPLNRGVIFMILAMACFASMNVSVRWLSYTMPTTQMVFLRNALSAVMVIGWILARYSPACFRTQRLKGHFWRAGIGFITMELWFYALSIMPLTTVTALSFTTPVFGALFAMWLLKEKSTWHHWAAMGASLAGVLIITQPGVQALHISTGIVLVAAALMALSGTVVKSLTRTEPPETIVFYMTALMTPLSLPSALAHWQPMEGAQWLGIILLAFLSTAAHLLIARAYRHADMVTLLPLDFLRLLFTAFLAWLVFGETMAANTLLGALIILGGAVHIVHREARRRKVVDNTLGNEP